MTSDKNIQISSINHVDYDDTFKKREKSLAANRSLAQQNIHINRSHKKTDANKTLSMIESNHTHSTTPTKGNMQSSSTQMSDGIAPAAAADKEPKALASQTLNTHTSPLRGFSNVSGQGNFNPPLSQAKKATKFEIISVQELDADEIDDGEESGDDAEDSNSELLSNQSRGSTCEDGCVLKHNSSRPLVTNNNLQPVAAPKTNPEQNLSSRLSMPMVPEVTFAPQSTVVNPTFNPSLPTNGDMLSSISQKIGHMSGNPGFVYGTTDSGEIFLPMSSTLGNATGVNFVDCSNQIIQPHATGINNALVSVIRHHAQGQMLASPSAQPGVGNILSQQPAVSTLNHPIISQSQGQLNTQHSTLNSTLSAYNIGPQSTAVTATPILPSRFRVVKKVKPFVGKRGRWDCRDVPCDVIMTSVGHSRSNPQASGVLPTNPNTLQHNIAGLQAVSNSAAAADQFFNSGGAALSKASQQVASNYNTSFALTEDISGSTKNPMHVPIVSHVTGSSHRGLDMGGPMGNFPISALDEALSNVTTNSDHLGRQTNDEHSDSNITSGGTYSNVPFLSSSDSFGTSTWARRSSTAEESTSSTVSNLANGDVGISNGAVVGATSGGGGVNRCSTGSEDNSTPEGMDDVTRKLVQVMEVVKTHVVLTVQEEFDMMKAELEEVRSRNAQLEAENSFFRQKQLSEVASGGKKRDVSVQVTLPNSPNQTSVQDAIVPAGLKSEGGKDNSELNSSVSSVSTTAVPQMNSNLPYVLLGFGNSPLATVGGATAHLQQTATPADFQTFIQRQAQFQPVSYFPMSLVNYGPQVGAEHLLGCGVNQSGEQVQSSQLAKSVVVTAQDSSGSSNANVQQVGQGNVTQTSNTLSTYSKAGTESGRNSSEPLKEGRKVSTVSEPGLNLFNDLASSSGQNFFPQLSGNLTHSSNQIAPLVAATASLQHQMQSALNNSTNGDYMLPIQNNRPPSNNPSGVPQVSTIAKTGVLHPAAVSGLLPGAAAAPANTSQQLFYMPSVAFQPMAPAAASGFSLSMIQQLQNANMHYPNPAASSQMQQSVLSPAHGLLQQSTFSAAGLNAATFVGSSPATGGPSVMQQQQQSQQQFFQINATGAYPLNPSAAVAGASNTSAVATAAQAQLQQQHQLQQSSNSLAAVSGANLGADVNQMSLTVGVGGVSAGGGGDPVTYTVVTASSAHTQTSQVVHQSVGVTTNSAGGGNGSSINASASASRS